MGDTTTFNADWNEGGGFWGLWKGTQALVYSFWLVYVLPVLLLLGIFNLILSGNFTDNETRKIFIIYIAVTFIFRVAAWISLIRCRKNVGKDWFTILVLIIVVLDILHKMVTWPIIIIMSVTT